MGGLKDLSRASSTNLGLAKTLRGLRVYHRLDSRDAKPSFYHGSIPITSNPRLLAAVAS